MDGLLTQMFCKTIDICIWDIPKMSIIYHYIKSQNCTLLKCNLRRRRQSKTRHNLLDRSRSFLTKATYPSAPSLSYEYEKLDTMRCEITRAAEKKCRKLCTGQVAFSPEIQQAHQIIKAWTLLKKRSQEGKISSRLTTRALLAGSSPSPQQNQIGLLNQPSRPTGRSIRIKISDRPYQTHWRTPSRFNSRPRNRLYSDSSENVRCNVTWWRGI